jgi:hypothetical protein
MNEFTLALRGRPVLVQVRDHQILDGDLDEQGEPLPDELVFQFRVFDLDEDAEITQLSPAEQGTIYQAILSDLQAICAGEGR